MKRDLVSVIMPAYNAEQYIRQPVMSVLGQTYPSIELIIVDDCSIDGTLRLVQDLASTDARIRIVRLPVNGGVAAARNAGIDVAQGSYIAFLDSDDWWHPCKLEWQIEHMLRTGTRISYASYDRVTENGGVLSHVQPPAKLSYADMLKSNHIGNLTGIYHRSLGDARFRAVGHEDYIFWLEMVRRAGSASCTPGSGPLAWYLVRGRSISSNKLRAVCWQWQIYRGIEGLGLVASISNMLHYLVHAVRKRS